MAKVCTICGEWKPCRCWERGNPDVRSKQKKSRKEVGNGNIERKSEVEAITYEEGFVPSKGSSSRNR